MEAMTMERIRNATVVYMNLNVEEHQKTLQHVYKVLDETGVRCVACLREDVKKSNFKKADLVIVVGGDGTFLRAAQFVDDQIMLGVNSHPREKEGFFMRSTREDFAEKLDRILGCNFRESVLARAGCKINGNDLIPALNEFYLGYPKAYHVARYLVKFKGQEERHKSSGILVGTPAGSHAWIGSASGKKMHINDEKLQWLVREPYSRKVTHPDKLSKGFLKKGEVLEVVSEMEGTAVVVGDSIEREYTVTKGDKVEFFLSDKPVIIAEFD